MSKMVRYISWKHVTSTVGLTPQMFEELAAVVQMWKPEDHSTYDLPVIVTYLRRWAKNGVPWVVFEELKNIAQYRPLVVVGKLPEYTRQLLMGWQTWMCGPEEKWDDILRE